MSLEETKMNLVQYPPISLDSDLNNDAGVSLPPKNDKVSLSGVFSKDTMSIAQKPTQQEAAAQVGIIGWILSWFYGAPSTTTTSTETNGAKGVDFSKPNLRRPDPTDMQHMQKFIKNLKEENAHREAIQAENTRTHHQESMDMMARLRELKQTMAQHTSSEVLEQHKINSQKKKVQRDVMDQSLVKAWYGNLLGRIHTGIGICNFLMAIGAGGVNPLGGVLLTVSQLLLTLSSEINKYKQNNLQVESIHNEKDITSRKEAISRHLDTLKRMNTEVTKAEEMMITALQKHQDTMTEVMKNT